MKTSELIEILQQLEGDPDVKIKVPSEYSQDAEIVTANTDNDSVTIYSN